MLWRNFVIFLDEMGWAKKAEMGTVKNIITADVLARRVMRTTTYETVDQNATFIGTANARELSELIRDTGTRRFVTLDMKLDPDHAVINAIDWHEVWQSVDERAVDPMKAFTEVLQDVQAEDRTPTPVEDLLASLSTYSIVGVGMAEKITARGFSTGLKISLLE